MLKLVEHSSQILRDKELVVKGRIGMVARGGGGNRRGGQCCQGRKQGSHKPVTVKVRSNTEIENVAKF